MAQCDDSGVYGWRVFFDGDDGVEELAGGTLLPPSGLLLAVPAAAELFTAVFPSMVHDYLGAVQVVAEVLGE